MGQSHILLEKQGNKYSRGRGGGGGEGVEKILKWWGSNVGNVHKIRGLGTNYSCNKDMV